MIQGPQIMQLARRDHDHRAHTNPVDNTVDHTVDNTADNTVDNTVDNPSNIFSRPRRQYLLQFSEAPSTIPLQFILVGKSLPKNIVAVLSHHP